MARKRNVNADNHLLTGGLITGFLTFMGFLPGAAASAAVTGVLVHDDIKKAKKQEDFRRDFVAHQKRCEKGKSEATKEFWRIEKIIDYLAEYNFDPESKEVVIQEKLETVFLGAKVIDYNNFKEKTENVKYISVEEMIELASNIEPVYKTVVLHSRDNEPSRFILERGDEKLVTSLGIHDRIPYNLRKVCEEWDIPFRKHSYSELKEVKTKIAGKLYAPYQFDYSKYH